MPLLRHILTLLLLVALISTITAIPRPQDDDVKKNEIDSDKELESADKQEVTPSVPMVYVTKSPASEYPTSGWGQFFIDILKIPLNLVRSMTHLFREAFTGKLAIVSILNSSSSSTAMADIFRRLGTLDTPTAEKSVMNVLSLLKMSAKVVDKTLSNLILRPRPICPKKTIL